MKFIYNDGSVTSLDHLGRQLFTKEMRMAGQIIEIFLSRDSFIKPATLALLTSWALYMSSMRSNFILSGHGDKKQYLERMNFHKYIRGLQQTGISRRVEGGRFLPVHLISEPADQKKALDAICDLMLKQFDKADLFLPEFEWVVSEITDNILQHSNTPVPGVLAAQFYPREKRIELAVVDHGRGIRESLSDSEAFQSLDSREAIEMALTQGVTRNEILGQGNGLAGTKLIIERNRGNLILWSDGFALRERGGKRTLHEIHHMRGVGIAIEMYINNPVDLSDTWLQKPNWSYLDRIITEISDGNVIHVIEECESIGTRKPAERLRRKIINIISKMEKDNTMSPIIISMDNMQRTPSSSFLDELFGKLACSLGRERLKRFVKIKAGKRTLGMIRSVVRNRVSKCWHKEGHEK